MTPRPTITIPDTFREPCAGPKTDGVATVGDLASFSIHQETSLQLCEGKRAGVIALVDAAQTKAKRPWWKLGAH